MRPRRGVLVASTALVAAALLSACGRGGTGDEAQPRIRVTATPPATRTVTAGAVDVEIKPIRLDGGGASFDVKLDTHSVDLGMDLTKVARLTVGGTAWTGASWKGAAPGGHHREGTLSFEPAGPAAGKVVLTIDGLPAPAEATWDLGGGSR